MLTSFFAAKMVTVWGGYVFVLNMIALHSALLVLLGRFGRKLYLSYSLFYIVGTVLAIQVPVVGWTPLKSLEQLGACAIFLGFQILYFCEVMIEKKRMSRAGAWKFRILVIFFAAVVGIIAILICVPSG